MLLLKGEHVCCSVCIPCPLNSTLQGMQAACGACGWRVATPLWGSVQGQLGQGLGFRV